MRALVQRVSSAKVEVAGETVGSIGHGLLVFVGFARDDADYDRAWVVSKVIGIRIFEDESGKMGQSVVDVKGGVLLVSQFTLYGDVRKGRRPSFDEAMRPELAEIAYGKVIDEVRAAGVHVESGRFRADMRVSSVNEGPVTLWIDSVDRVARPTPG